MIIANNILYRLYRVNLMDIKHIIFAESIVFGQNGKPIIQGILPGYIVLPFTPTVKRVIPFSLSAAIIAMISDDTMPEMPKIHVEVIDPTGAMMIKADSDRNNENVNNLAKNADHIASGFVMLDFRNFPFALLGKYTFKFTIDDKELEYELIATSVIDDEQN